MKEAKANRYPKCCGEFVTRDRYRDSTEVKNMGEKAPVTFVGLTCDSCGRTVSAQPYAPTKQEKNAGIDEFEGAIQRWNQ